MRLNQFGRMFLEHVDRAPRELDAATREVRDSAGLELGSVSLAAGALHRLPEVLLPFLSTHPEVRFRLAQRSLPEMVRLLNDGGIDYCFLSVIPVTPRTRWHHLRTAPISLVVPSSHRLAIRASIELREVRGCLPRNNRRLFGQGGITAHVTCEADEPTPIEEFVKAVVGDAFVPKLRKPPPRHELTNRAPSRQPCGGCCVTRACLARYPPPFWSGKAKRWWGVGNARTRHGR